MRSVLLASFFVSAIFLGGCGAQTSCQSGPKYGTQCYNSSNQTVYSAGGQAQPSAAPPQTTRTEMPATPAR